MFNVAPQPNTAAIIASMLGQVFPSNYLEEETAWNLARAELESALRCAGFAQIEIKPGAGRDSNVLLVAMAGLS